MNLRDVNADVAHHVIDALEARAHLVNCDHKAEIFHHHTHDQNGIGQ